ncbi:MAG: hypothetical protein WBX49_01685 [Candidatus Deferrimicrobiaceae bacterium]
MRSRIKGIFYLIVPLLLVLLFARPAVSNDTDGEDRDGGSEIPDLVVRKVTVAPVRAHVGDVIRIEMEWDFWGDITENAYDTNVAAVRANGKVVASKSYTADFNGVRPGETYRETFLWDTKGVAPGTYRIRGEVPVKIEKTPYDNYLDVKEPVLLIPAGASFPAGKESGGSAVAESPY